MSWEHMSRNDIASLAHENMQWISTLAHLAKKNEHCRETLLDIIDYFVMTQCVKYTEMEKEFIND